MVALLRWLRKGFLFQRQPDERGSAFRPAPQEADARFEAGGLEAEYGRRRGARGGSQI
jgi:hypothetical protein